MLRLTYHLNFLLFSPTTHPIRTLFSRTKFAFSLACLSNSLFSPLFFPLLVSILYNLSKKSWPFKDSCVSSRREENIQHAKLCILYIKFPSCKPLTILWWIFSAFPSCLLARVLKEWKKDKFLATCLLSGLFVNTKNSAGNLEIRKRNRKSVKKKLNIIIIRYGL